MTKEIMTARIDEETFWMGTFHAMWKSLSSAFSSRGSSAIDTTPPHDMKEFQTAAATLTGLANVPWREATSYTKIPVCRQQESWDCGKETRLSIDNVFYSR
jgi:hypothetical protein